MGEGPHLLSLGPQANHSSSLPCLRFWQSSNNLYSPSSCGTVLKDCGLPFCISGEISVCGSSPPSFGAGAEVRDDLMLSLPPP